MFSYVIMFIYVATPYKPLSESENMARLGTTRTVILDNPFTVGYHRTGAAKAQPAGRRKAQSSSDDYEDSVRNSVHPINRGGSILLGEGAVGCDWNDHVLLPDAKGVDITSKELVFAYKASDNDKEVYVKNMAAIVRNIIFNVHIGYTLVYKGTKDFEVIINTFTTTNALNSQGKFIALTLSDTAKKDIIMAVLEFGEDQIKERGFIAENIKPNKDIGDSFCSTAAGAEAELMMG